MIVRGLVDVHEMVPIRDAVEHQATQGDVQIGRRAEALDERDAACARLLDFQTAPSAAVPFTAVRCMRRRSGSA